MTPNRPLTRSAFIGYSSAAALTALTTKVAKSACIPIPFSSLHDSRPVVVRPTISEVAADPAALARLKRAFKNMMDWDISHPGDPRGWAAQSGLHGQMVQSSPNGGPHCIHYGWNFQPWHRAYLYFFERILSWHSTGQSGVDPTFRIPVWDWEAHEDYVQFPDAYADQSNNNPLWVAGRSYASRGPINLLANLIDVQTMFDALPIDFFGTEGVVGSDNGGSSETKAHNTLHGWVGGVMSWMASSASDPVFYAHHANIDKLWYWYSGFSGTGGAPMTKEQWTFTDEQLRCFVVSQADVTDTTKLAYKYADAPQRYHGPTRAVAAHSSSLTRGSIALTPQQRHSFSEKSVRLRLHGIAVPHAGDFVLVAIDTSGVSHSIAAVTHLAHSKAMQQQPAKVNVFASIPKSVAKVVVDAGTKLQLRPILSLNGALGIGLGQSTPPPRGSAMRPLLGAGRVVTADKVTLIQ